jgi:hypothetical protein
MAEVKKADKILVGKPEGTGRFRDPGIDERIIFKWAIKK